MFTMHHPSSIINQAIINHQSIINHPLIDRPTDQRTQTMTTTDNNRRTPLHSCTGLPFGAYQSDLKAEGYTFLWVYHGVRKVQSSPVHYRKDRPTDRSTDRPIDRPTDNLSIFKGQSNIITVKSVTRIRRLYDKDQKVIQQGSGGYDLSTQI